MANAKGHKPAQMTAAMESLFGKVADSRCPTSRAPNFFLDYMQNMLDAALSGEVSDYFAPPSQHELDSEFSEESPEESMTALPDTASLKPCSRPALRKRLRPREIPPGAEEFPMDCLESAPACMSAPPGPRIKHWAELMQDLALAEDTSNDLATATTVDETPCVSRASHLDKVVGVPSAPAMPTAGCRRPSPYKYVAKEELSPTPPASTEPSDKFTAPVPPSEPARSERIPSYRRPRGAPAAPKKELLDGAFRVSRHSGARKGSVSPRPPMEPFRDALAPVWCRASGPEHRETAMAMDLGSEVASNLHGLPGRQDFIISMTESHSFVGAAKTMGVLPPILQPTWTCMETSCGSRRAHDVV